MSASQKEPPGGPQWGNLRLILSAIAIAILAFYLPIGPFSPHLSFKLRSGPAVGLGPTFTRNVSLCPGSVYISLST